MSRWRDALPRPVAVVLSGGGTLGALQVGALRALAEADFEPDLVVGTSAGALNGAMLAAHGTLGRTAQELERIWRGLTRDEVFPGGRVHQAVRVVTRRSLHPNDGLRALIRREMPVVGFDRLHLDLGVLATDALSGQPHLFTAGALEPALLASAAIPGVLPAITIGDRPYWDGGVSSMVPLRAALQRGAASLVVVDVRGVCPRERLPSGLPATFTAALSLAIRQRVLVEAPVIAEQLPMLYLPRPCVHTTDPLDFAEPVRLIDTTYELVQAFLASAAVPTPGSPSGGPHIHEPSPLDEQIRFDRA